MAVREEEKGDMGDNVRRVHINEREGERCYDNVLYW